jgi:hypothetical protein
MARESRSYEKGWVRRIVLCRFPPLSVGTTQHGQLDELMTDLDEAESTRDEQEGLKEELEKVRLLPQSCRTYYS